MTSELIVCPGCDKWSVASLPPPPLYPCCNPDCNGMRGTGCHHCHHPSYFAENIHRRWRQARPASDQYAGNMGRAIRLLRALALEIDERVATRTGEQVCRACGGRGEVIVAWFPTGSWPGCQRWIEPSVDERHIYSRVRSVYEGRPLPTSLRIEVGGPDRIADPAIVTEPCACDGPARPVTVSLHGLVQSLAGRPPPDENPSSFEPMRDIPERWLVDIDAMEAAGWRDVVLPSTKADHAARCKWWNENRNRRSTPAERDDNGSDPQPHHPGLQGPRVTPAWQCRWWRAWSAWARGGETPDADALAQDLLRLLPALEARERSKAEALQLRRPDGLYSTITWAGVRVYPPERTIMLESRPALRARCETLAAEAGIDPDALWSAAEELSRTTASNFEDALDGIASTHGLMGTVGRVLLPAFGDMIDAVHEFMGEHEATVAATVPSLLDRITSTEAPAEPQRGGPPVGGRLARRLRKRRE